MKYTVWFAGLAVTGLALAVVTPADGQVVTNDPSLPPIVGEYRTAQDVHASYGGGLLTLEDIRHFGFTNIVRQDVASDEQEQFDSSVSGLVSVFDDPPAIDVPFTLTGPVVIRVTNKVGNTVGTFDTEMLQMNLSGNTPLGPGMIRESPTLSSTGRTTIQTIPGGMYHIDSFFDIFTEISIDGGQTWMPNEGGPTRVTLVPEPSALALSALALSLMRRRSR